MASSRIKNTLQSEYARLARVHRRNVQVLRQQPLQELSGAFGDLGTLLPILISFFNRKEISLSSTLVFSGLANILTGAWFGIPLPVQPMKAIAAGVLANPMSRYYTEKEVASAGIFVAAVVGFLSVTGLLEWATRRIPIPIIKGIQLGTGLSLMLSSGALLRQATDAFMWIPVIAFLMYCQTHPRVPYTLIVVLISLVGMIDYYKYHSDKPALWSPNPFVPSPSNFFKGASELGIGQVPLTLLNSIVAVTFLSTDLIPEVEAPTSTALGISVSGMNMVGCWFGAMPICHGSGGLAAQYRFGARSGSSIIILGLIKLILGLFFTPYAMSFFEQFPKSQLGVLLFLAGLELVKVGESLNNEGARDFWIPNGMASGSDDESKVLREVNEEEKKRRWAVMFIMIGAILVTKNAGIGFLAGIMTHLSYELSDRWEVTRAQAGRIRLGEEETRPQEASRSERSEV